jgi:hypothetical protein
VSTSNAYQTLIGASAVAALLFVQSWIGKRAQDHRHRENTAKLDAQADKLDEVEKTVNGNFDKALTEISELKALLTAHGITVPPRPVGEET